MRITTKKYNIIDKVNTNIVLISDIHYYCKKDIKHLNNVLDKIKKISPNFICIPGDIIDEANVLDVDCFILWLKKLSEISEVFIALGNHEYYIDKENRKYGLSSDFINKLNNIDNLYLLDNKNKIEGNINFIGLTLPIEYYFENSGIDNYLNNIKTINNKYNILLCHSPVDMCNKELLKDSGINLILCGHMHGGLAPRMFRSILKNRGLISPTMKLFPKYAYGNIKIEKTNIIISSGITVISHLNKFRILKNLFSSEIVYINIKKS